MAKKKNTEELENESVQNIVLADVVKHIYKGDIIKYVNEHPDCGYTTVQLVDYFQEQGYFVIKL